METKRSDSENRYLLLDSQNVPLAHVIIEGDPRNEILTARITDEKAEDVLEHEIYRLLGLEKQQPLIQCQLVSKKEKRIVLERTSFLAPELQKDLRVPLHVNSFLYFPLENGFGRYEIQFVDISCGGMAFYGPEGVEKQENLEVVLPITAQPLIVPCKILSAKKLYSDKMLCAAKFCDLCNAEEKMIREAVFGIQLEERSRQIRF